jgi:hypothetical protein
MTFDPNDNNLDRFKNERHQHCITQPWMNVPVGLPHPPPAVDQAAVLGLLNATIARQVNEQEVQNTILTKQLKQVVEKDGSNKNRVENLHESTIKMLLFKQSQLISQILASNSSTAKHPPLPSKSSTFSSKTME